MLSLRNPVMKTSIQIRLKRIPACPGGNAGRPWSRVALAHRVLGVALIAFWAASSFAVEGISDNALAQIRAFQAEKLARTPAQQKLDSQIVYALRQSRNELAAFGITSVN